VAPPVLATFYGSAPINRFFILSFHKMNFVEKMTHFGLMSIDMEIH